jgi:hypothetical protein
MEKNLYKPYNQLIEKHIKELSQLNSKKTKHTMQKNRQRGHVGGK